MLIHFIWMHCLFHFGFFGTGAGVALVPIEREKSTHTKRWIRKREKSACTQTRNCKGNEYSWIAFQNSRFVLSCLCLFFYIIYSLLLLLLLFNFEMKSKRKQRCVKVKCEPWAFRSCTIHCLSLSFSLFLIGKTNESMYANLAFSFNEKLLKSLNWSLIPSHETHVSVFLLSTICRWFKLFKYFFGVIFTHLVKISLIFISEWDGRFLPKLTSKTLSVLLSNLSNTKILDWCGWKKICLL